MKLKSSMRRSDKMYKGLIDLIAVLPGNLTMAEVGCYAGESTMMFMESGKVDVIYAIDPWNGQHYLGIEWAEETFDARIKGHNIVKYKAVLSEVVDKLPPLDFMYIDGDHRYEYVKEDIQNALKVVKKGGIIAGHDYNLAIKKFGVVKAVDEAFGKPDKVFKDTSWIKYL